MSTEDKRDVLMQHCADIGVMVEYADLGPRRLGEYWHPDRIVLNRRNRADQMLSAHAHETGHAIACENGATANCKRADEYGAALIISVQEYREAEEIAGSHPGAIARHIGVTRRLILGWQRWYLRTHAPPAVESDQLP